MQTKEILIIDNYDSFTYNLVHYFEDLNCKVTVFRNDEYALDEIQSFQNIVLSPGPGLPQNSGLLLDTIRTYAPTKRILGICLGMQAIGEVFGAQLINLEKVYHGLASKIKIIDSNTTLFKGLDSEFEVGRYHSWAISTNLFPNDLKVTAQDEIGTIMAIQHKNLDVCGVQFHPESILTPNGKQILSNWIL